MTINEPAVSAQKQNVSHRKETILVVDDEPVLRKLNAHILASQGYVVIEAPTAAKALELLAEESVDLVITDVFMPKMNGYELAEQMAQDYSSVAIQLISGCGGEKQQSAEAEQLNAQLLQKPFAAEKLLAHVRERLDNR